MVFRKLFLRLPVVLSSSPLKISEGFCCGIHGNRIHVIRNDLICFFKKASFAFIMDAKRIEYGTIFFSGGKGQW